MKQMHKLPLAPLVGLGGGRGTLAGSREGPGSSEVGLSMGAEIAILRQCYWTQAYPADGQEKDVQTL